MKKPGIPLPVAPANFFEKSGNCRVNRKSGSRLSVQLGAVSSSLLDRRCSSLKCQSQRGDVLKIGLQMIEQSMDGRLFFRGARELHACIAYNVTQHGARIYSDRLGVLPIDFYVSFDNFETIGKCRLAWRHRDHIGVVFEKWIDARAAHVVTSESDPA